MADALARREPLRLRALRRLAEALPRLAPAARRLPPFPGSAALAAALNLLIGAPDEALDPLLGRTVSIRVLDAGLRFDLRLERTGFAAVPASSNADVVIHADARDFLALALRETDPDTSFFARRLVVEGNTELGLLLKNRLDALDPADLTLSPASPAPLLRAAGAALGLRGPFSRVRPPARRRARPPSRC